MSRQFDEVKGAVSRLRFEYKNCGLFVIVSWSGNIVPIQFRRPEGCTGTRPGRDFSDLFVMIWAFLLIGEYVSQIKSSSAGNVHTLTHGVEIDAVLALTRRVIGILFACNRVHGDHFWRLARAYEQPMSRF